MNSLEQWDKTYAIHLKISGEVWLVTTYDHIILEISWELNSQMKILQYYQKYEAMNVLLVHVLILCWQNHKSKKYEHMGLTHLLYCQRI